MEKDDTQKLCAARYLRLVTLAQEMLRLVASITEEESNAFSQYVKEELEKEKAK